MKKYKIISNGYILCITSLTLLSLTLITSFILSSYVFADDTVVDEVSITVPVSCTLNGSVDTEHTATIQNGTYTANIGTTTLTTFCNDASGFAIYAIGYTGETYGDNTLVGANTGLTIATDTTTGGTTSNWAMKLTKVTDSSTSYIPANLIIENSFDSYHTVPAEYTKVASYSSTTDITLGSKLTTTYAAYISNTQSADTYEGKVKYTMVHPASATTPTPKYYMQDLTLAQCQSLASSSPLTVYDRRDESDYTIRYLNNVCWMTQNLRIVGTVSATDSNFTGSDFNISTGSLTSGDSYTEPRSAYNDNETYGAYYNYCAASAGTVCGITAEDAKVDICPSGWHLPSYDEAEDIVDSEGANWNPVSAGLYTNGRLGNIGNLGYWWVSTGVVENISTRFFLGVEYGEDWGVLNNSYAYGCPIRCVRSE